MTQINQYTKKNGDKFYKFNLYLGKDEFTGKKVYALRQGFKTKREAQIAMSKLLEEVVEKGVSRKRVTTFKELYDMWLEQHRLNVKASTVATNRRFVEKHVLPSLGHFKLNRITVVYCQQLVNEWHQEYKQYSYFRKVAAQIMKYGVSLELMDNNPMAKTILPRKQEVDKPINFYTKEETKHFFECLEDHDNLKMLAYFRLLAFTGMRKSEAFALQWKDIDIFNKAISIGKTIAVDENNLVIMQTTKTTASERKISLDNQTIKVLERWRIQQREELLMLGFNASKKGQHVFATLENKLFYPQKANEWLTYLLDKYKLKKITPHGFRHTHCSLMFESGSTIKEVQERLGHKDIKTTMNVYAHVTPKAEEESAQKFANYVGF